MHRAIVVSAIFFSGIAQATVVSSDFESGSLGSWSSIGDVSMFTGDPAVAPIEGTYSAHLMNGPGSVSDTLVEDFLGLSNGTLDSFSAGLSAGTDVNQGSAMSYTYSGNAGDVVSFDFIYLTDEALNNPNYNDFAFASINGVLLVADTYADGTSYIADNSSAYWGWASTGVLSFEYTIGSTGTIDIGLGVLQVTDPTVNTVLLVDNFAITAVPVPAAVWMFMSGLGFLGWRHRRNAA